MCMWCVRGWGECVCGVCGRGWGEYVVWWCVWEGVG